MTLLQQEQAGKPAEMRERLAAGGVRERDLAQELGVSEGHLVAALCGAGGQAAHRARRLRMDMAAMFEGLQSVGEVMSLTRNDAAVHEKIGRFEHYVRDGAHAMVRGAEIDTRLRPERFVHAFEVVKQVKDGERRSLQFFGGDGEAVQKVHTRPATDMDAWHALVGPLVSEDQDEAFVAKADTAAPVRHAAPQSLRDAVRAEWREMTDTLQIETLLSRHGLARNQALSLLDEEFAWRLDGAAVDALFAAASEAQLPLMCFVGSRGCIQIHSGPIRNVKEMGPWLNVMDPTFHLHLRRDLLAEIWAVRKPVRRKDAEGHVTSLEAFDAEGNLAIQFFGTRQPGHAERTEWRQIAENLPRNAGKTSA